jgi:hypothetical protein
VTYLVDNAHTGAHFPNRSSLNEIIATSSLTQNVRLLSVSALARSKMISHV